MILFRKKAKKLKHAIVKMEENLKVSFLKVKDEMETVNKWLTYQNDRSNYLEGKLDRIALMADEVSKGFSNGFVTLGKHSSLMGDMANKLVAISRDLRAVEAIASDNVTNTELNFHIENISREIQRFQHKIESVAMATPTITAIKEQLHNHMAEPHSIELIEQKINAIQEKINDLVIKKTPKEKLVQKVKKNQHDYIKAVILSYIEKYGKISSFQLREIVVEEQNLTSRSTFYRILEEVEEMEGINILREGKEKLYFSKLKKRN